jgi:hypothetical protein
MSVRSPLGEFVRRALLALVPAVLLLAAAAATATASTRQESILQDDRLFGNPALQIEALDTADALGVDTIHSVVVWDSVAPANDERRKPSGFNGADLGDYEAAKWDRFDSLVREANRRGIDLLLSPSGPVPTWASSCRRPGTPKVCRPKPSEYQAFFTAVVKRYNGRTRDENQGGGVLPKVDRFSVWNEPNLKGWIQPTSQNAKIYRSLIYAAEKGLRAGRQPRAQLLIGETAPLKSLTFIQRLFCIDPRGRSLRGRIARRYGCKSGRRIRKMKATGFAHHPYSRGGEPPFKRRGRTDITLRYIGRLKKVLNQAGKRGAIRRNMPQYITEFGISSDPPSEKFGVAPEVQARELNRAEYAAWRNRSIRSFTQFQLSDDTGIGQRGDPVNFQTGLRFRDNSLKPAFGAFRMPIYVTRAKSRKRIWGGVRPGAGDRVEIQAQSGGNWTTVAAATVNRYGYINRTIASSASKFRLRWVDNGVEYLSREASVNRP